jgi:CheY-like chemotaxis protein/nitrogen-specific signal transduction histidine kinase
MVGLNWDITQRKRAEDALRDKLAAERASRAKSEFLARMSHELRTPLNAVLGFAQLMLHDGDARLDALQIDRVSRIRAAGAHLLSLIEDVLDLASIEAGTLTVQSAPTSLDEAFDEVRQWVAPMAARRQVGLHLQHSGAVVLGDARRVRQILANLMTNAVKYNHVGGQVWVSAQLRDEAGVAGWALSVRDNGRGLSQEQQAHLFEPFNRLGAEREDIEGRGLGLMTVHHLTQLLGGRLCVQSRPGEGSEFSLWLPSATHGTPAGPAVAVAVAAMLSVLYIEDNPVNAMVVSELVAMRAGVSLHTAVDGASGVAQALRDAPDLVLVDMQLPDIDGCEVVRRLRGLGCRATLIALSANAVPEEAVRARAAGFDDYWTKPIDFQQFLNGLDRIAAARTASAPTAPSFTEKQDHG